MSKGEWSFVIGCMVAFVLGFMPPFFYFWKLCLAVAALLGLA